MSEHNHFFDKNSMLEIGFALWQIRQQRRLYLSQVEKRAHVPAKMIDGLETGRSFHYGALRKLVRFYDKKLCISLK